jgi:preprotein translocase subunit SecA
MVDASMTREEFAQIGEDGVAAQFIEEAISFYNRKEEQLGTENIAQLERFASLRVIDDKWRDHLREMDELKEGIGLRAYGQKDPLVEYKQEGYRMFQELLVLIRDGVLELAFKLYPMVQDQRTGQMVPAQPGGRRMLPNQAPQRSRAVASKAAAGSGLQGGAEPEIPEPRQVPQTVRTGPKVGRNDPCPCGSGKKYKNCHGAGQ